MTEPDEDEQFYRDTESIAFPKLDDRQLAMLEPLGARRIVRRGELIFKAGQRDLRLDRASCAARWKSSSRATGRSKSSRLPGPRDFIGDVGNAHGHGGAGQRARQSGGKRDSGSARGPAAAGARGAAGRQRTDRARVHHAPAAAGARPASLPGCASSRRMARAKAASSTIFSTRIISRTG